MNISTKIKLRQKIKFAQNLVLYSRRNNRLLIKKNFFSKKKYVQKKYSVLIILLNISIINIILTK